MAARTKERINQERFVMLRVRIGVICLRTGMKKIMRIKRRILNIVLRLFSCSISPSFLLVNFSNIYIQAPIAMRNPTRGRTSFFQKFPVE